MFKWYLEGVTKVGGKSSPSNMSRVLREHSSFRNVKWKSLSTIQWLERKFLTTSEGFYISLSRFVICDSFISYSIQVSESLYICGKSQRLELDRSIFES